MKRQLNSTRSSALKDAALLVCAFALALGLMPQHQPPRPGSYPHAGAAPVPEIRFVKSEFVTKPGFGKDHSSQSQREPRLLPRQLN